MRQEHFVQKLLQQINCRKSRLKTFQVSTWTWQHLGSKMRTLPTKWENLVDFFSLGSVRREMNSTWALASGSCPIDGQSIIALHRKKWNLPRCSAYSRWFCTERLCIDQLTNGASGKSYEAILCHAMIGVSRCQVLVFQWSSPTKSVDMLPCNDFGNIWILWFWSLLLTFCDYFLSCLHEQLAMFTGERSATSRTRCATMFEG